MAKYRRYRIYIKHGKCSKHNEIGQTYRSRVKVHYINKKKQYNKN